MIRALSLSTIVLGITTAINYGTFIVLARVAGAEAFGQYLYDLTTAGVLSVIVSYASQRVFTKDVLETKSDQRSFNSLVTVRFVLGALGLVILILWGSVSDAGTPYAALFLVYHLFQLSFLFEYSSRTVELALITLLEKAVYCILVSFWVLTYGFSWHVYGLFLLSSLLSISIQAGRNKKFVSSFKLCPRYDIQRYLKRYLALVLIDLTQLTYGNFSRLIIQHKNGLLDFGAVSVSFQIIKVASIFQTQAEYIFRPKTIRLTQKCDIGALKEHTRKYLHITTIPTLFGSMLLLFCADPLIHLVFGDQYEKAIPVLQILSVLPVLVNLIRFVEMIHIGLNTHYRNFSLNFLVCAGLLAALTILPSNTPLTTFVWLIASFQFIYLTSISYFAVHKLLQNNSDRTDI